MREPIRDNGRLEHILSAIENVEKYTQGFDFETFSADSLRVHATIYNVQVIGEAVYHLSNEFKESHPETIWRLIEKTRHILVHDYYQIQLDILWNIVIEDLPLLKNQVNKYLSE